MVCSTSWSIIHYIFNSFSCFNVPFIFLSAAPFHILYYTVTYRSHTWLLLLDDCCWTSGLFIGELSYLRTGRLMVEIYLWGKPICSPCCYSFKSCLSVPNTGNRANFRCGKLEIYSLSMLRNRYRNTKYIRNTYSYLTKNTMFSILTKIRKNIKIFVENKNTCVYIR